LNLNNLQPNTPRKSIKRVGRGGKRGTYSGKGQKGQKSRAGAGIKLGFRGGDNRLWQLFPKQRGASHKPGGAGNNRIHVRHRFYQLRKDKSPIINIEEFNKFNDEETVTPKILFEKGMLKRVEKSVKVLGDGELGKKLVFEGFSLSKSARDKIVKAGGKINN